MVFCKVPLFWFAFFLFLFNSSPQCETFSSKSTKGCVKKTVVTFGSIPPRAFFSSRSTQTPLSPTLPTSFPLSPLSTLAQRLRGSLSPASRGVDFKPPPRHRHVRSTSSPSLLPSESSAPSTACIACSTSSSRSAWTACTFCCAFPSCCRSKPSDSSISSMSATSTCSRTSRPFGIARCSGPC